VAQRDSRTDLLKAVAIIGVVVIHTGWPWGECFRFGVPVFVALWAYYFELGLAKRQPPDDVAFLKSRFVRLFVPYLFWTLLYLFLQHPLAEWQATPVAQIVGAWFGGHGWNGQYFFIVLFQLVFLMPLLRMIRRPWPVICLGLVFNVFVNALLFDRDAISGPGDRLAVYWIPYALIGIALTRENGSVPRHRWFLIPALAILLAAPLELELLKETAPKVSPYLMFSVGLASLLILLATGPQPGTTSPIPRRQSRVRTLCLRPLEALGRNTFVIFVGHMLFLDLAREAGLSLEGEPLASALRHASLVVAAIAGSLILAWILRRLRLGLLVGG
jgi:peptidoglycan/LPS O-acetylase OafA/YrhL